MQRPHSLRHLFWRTVVASVAQTAMVSGLYPMLPFWLRQLRGETPGATLMGALYEWSCALAITAARPAGFFPLPGATVRGPRPIIVVHGYSQNRANFLLLSSRLAAAGLGPVIGFEYWTLGRTAAAARQLGWFVDEVRVATGAESVDIVGHSMGGVVGLYYVSLAGGDGIVDNLITLGSPIAGTDVSSFGIGHPGRELLTGSKLVTRLAAAPPPKDTRVTTIWSTADAFVPGVNQPVVPGAERIMYNHLGHVSLLASRQVADDVIARLSRKRQS